MTTFDLNTGQILINGKTVDDIVIEALLNMKDETKA